MSLDVYLTNWRGKQVYWSNITHNLTEMANAAGIYDAVWSPEKIGITRAKELIPILQNALDKMESTKYFKRFDSDNGWGLYEHFVPWLREYLQACEKHPRAKISVDR